MNKVIITQNSFNKKKANFMEIIYKMLKIVIPKYLRKTSIFKMRFLNYK